MLYTVHRYLYTYNGEELSIIGIWNKLSNKEQKEQIKEKIIAEFGDFDRKKLKFVNYKEITGVLMG